MEKAYEQMKVVEEDAKKEAKKKAMVEQQAVDDATKITEVLVDPTISSALQEDGEQVVSPWSPMQQRLMRLFKHVNMNLHLSRLTP